MRRKKTAAKKPTAEQSAKPLSVKALEQHGAFVGPPVEKTVEWRQGKETLSGIVYIRQASCETFEHEMKAQVTRKDFTATRIASMVCSDEKGTPLLNYEQALALTEPLTNALLTAIREVNGEKK